MGSQFVDLNRDGHLDYLTATFDGSPHVAYGGEKGFLEPKRLHDAEGRRILISYYWDYDKKSHLKTGRSMPDGKAVAQRLISALAFDWDGDGDHDLLLGSYEEGHLYRQMNEGTDAAPKYTGKNVPVLAGDIPFAVPDKMTTPRLVDWDGDGDLDLVAGSFGDSRGHKDKGGGVYLSLNQGEKGAPKFGPLQTLVPPSPKGHTAPTRPDAGLYADPVDFDGDGDLDLLVGGYSLWTPPQRELTNEEKATVVQLKADKREAAGLRRRVMNERSLALREATKGLDRKSREYRDKRKAVYAEFANRYAGVDRDFRRISANLAKLVSGPQRKSFVWIYERL